MIKAYSKNANILFIGLTDENVERLTKDQPIRFNLKQLGLNDANGDIVIFHGKTEIELKKMMFQAGLIDVNKTEIRDYKADKN